MASFLSCSRCGLAEGTKWTLDAAGDVWEWCPDCSQQLEFLAEAPEFAQVDRVRSVSAMDEDEVGLVPISEITARLLSEDGLPF